jgi:hypothetical protein
VLQELFAQCSLKVEDVESIQLVGSVTRMPSLCRAIKVATPLSALFFSTVFPCAMRCLPTFF